MSALAIAVPGSVEQGTETQTRQQQQDITNLAYALWQQRGCPEGSPEQNAWMVLVAASTSPLWGVPWGMKYS